MGSIKYCHVCISGLDEVQSSGKTPCAGSDDGDGR